MRLSYLLFEALNVNILRQLKIVASELDIPEDKLTSIINDIDPSNKYVEWVLRQIRFKNIRVPEDNNRVKEVINQFKQHQSRLQQKDLNQYKTIHDVEEALEKVTSTGSKREGAFQVNPEKLQGVELVNQDGDYKLWEISDPLSLGIMGEGTKWCTRKSYEPCQAKNYIEDQTIIYIISKDNIPIIQFTPDFEQIMDRNDNRIQLEAYIKLLKPLENNLIDMLYEAEAEAETHDYEDNYMLDAVTEYSYAISKRIPEFEEIIMKYPIYASEYAIDMIGVRWLEAEPFIIKDPAAAYYYAMSIIKGRWLKAEPTIVKSDYAVKYAMNILEDRWPEAEPYILNDAGLLLHYIKEVIYERWPAAEPYLIKYLEEELSGNSITKGGHENIVVAKAISEYIQNHFTEDDKWPEIRPFIQFLYTRNWKIKP